MFRFLRPNSGMLCLFLVHCQLLSFSQTHNFADWHHARLHRVVSGMLLVTCKWRDCCRFLALHGLSGVPIGALSVVLQQWLLVASLRRTLQVADVG